MTFAGDTQTRFSEVDQAELSDYSPLNRFALIALIFGCIGVVALIHPLLCTIPVLGVITAGVALRQLRSTDNKQSGYNLALLGLFLSLLFGTWGIARESSRELRLYRQARQFADDWLNLFHDGRIFEAHQLTLKESMRAASGVSLEKHYERPKTNKMDDMRVARESGNSSPELMMEVMEPSPFETFEGFMKEPLVKRLQDIGTKGRYEFLENVQILTTGAASEQIVLMYFVRDGQSAFPVRIVLEREFQAGVADWNVTRIIDPNKP